MGFALHSYGLLDLLLLYFLGFLGRWWNRLRFLLLDLFDLRNWLSLLLHFCWVCIFGLDLDLLLDLLDHRFNQLLRYLVPILASDFD